MENVVERAARDATGRRPLFFETNQSIAGDKQVHFDDERNSEMGSRYAGMSVPGLVEAKFGSEAKLRNDETRIVGCAHGHEREVRAPAQEVPFMRFFVAIAINEIHAAAQIESRMCGINMIRTEPRREDFLAGIDIGAAADEGQTLHVMARALVIIDRHAESQRKCRFNGHVAFGIEHRTDTEARRRRPAAREHENRCADNQSFSRLPIL